MFRDKAGAIQDVLSVEVYLPWNNTWLELPTLPAWTNDAGTVRKITLTQILSLTMSSGSTVCLLGGEHADLDTYVGTHTPHVWMLSYHRGNHTYYWDHHTALAPDMGKCVCVCVRHLLILILPDMDMEVWGRPVVGVPDTFYAP